MCEQETYINRMFAQTINHNHIVNVSRLVHQTPLKVRNSPAGGTATAAATDAFVGWYNCPKFL